MCQSVSDTDKNGREGEGHMTSSESVDGKHL